MDLLHGHQLENYLPLDAEPYLSKFLKFMHVRSGNGKTYQLPDVIDGGVQKVNLHKFASKLQGLGWDDAEIESSLRTAALRCNPPAENLDHHVQDIMRSVRQYPKGPAVASVREVESVVDKSVGEDDDTRAQPKSQIIGDNENWIKPWGFWGTDFYYSSSNNPHIVKISAAAHTQNTFLTLLPLEWWEANYQPTDKARVRWDRAASQLMEACEHKGEYSEWNHRGRGAWKHKGKTIFNLGSSIYHLSTGQSEELGRIDSSHIFTVSKSSRPPYRQVPTSFKPEKLVEICHELPWKNKTDAKLFSGWIAISRMCGALQWRPHLWITGSKGTGKTTILTDVLGPTIGEFGLPIKGESTAAGIRQLAKCDAVPILFDEAQTSVGSQNHRIKAIVEYARQCSSDSGSVVAKGTADGKGVRFKASNVLYFSSVKVELVEEQDLSRFTVMELVKPDVSKWVGLRKRISDVLTVEYGHELWSFVCNNWGWVERKIVEVEDEIAEKLNDRRIAQQHAPMIVGWMLLSGKKDSDVFDVGKMINKFEIRKSDDEDLDSFSCLDAIFQLEIRVGMDSKTIGQVLQGYGLTDDERQALSIFGIDKDGEGLFIATTSINLSKHLPSVWGHSYIGSLSRIPGAERQRHYFLGGRRRAIRIPLQYCPKMPSQK